MILQEIMKEIPKPSNIPTKDAMEGHTDSQGSLIFHKCVIVLKGRDNSDIGGWTDGQTKGCIMKSAEVALSQKLTC